MIDPLIERVEARIKDAAGHSDNSVQRADLRAQLEEAKKWIAGFLDGTITAPEWLAACAYLAKPSGEAA